MLWDRAAALLPSGAAGVRVLVFLPSFLPLLLFTRSTQEEDVKAKMRIEVICARIGLGRSGRRRQKRRREERRVVRISLPMAKPLVFVVAVGLALVACKKNEPSLGGGLPPSEACTKLETVFKAPFPPAKKDECLAMFATFGPNMKICMDGCVTNAKSDRQFDDCKEACYGKGPSAR